MSEKTVFKYLSEAQLPTLISKIRAKILEKDITPKVTAESERVDGLLAALPTTDNIRAIATEEATKKFDLLMGPGNTEALDTVKEIAEALGEDKNFSTTILGKIGENKTAIENVDGRVDNVNTALDGKVAQTEFNTLSGNVSNLSETVTGLTSSISGINTSIAGINTSLLNKVDASEMNTAINDAIQTKADATTVTQLQNAVNNCVTETQFVEITQDEIDAKINEVFAAE